VTVNTLVPATPGWIFALNAPVTATSGVNLPSGLTILGGNVLTTSPSGAIDGTTLTIPDTSGVTAGSFGLDSLILSGGGNATVLGGAVGSGANLFSVTLSNGSSIDLFGNGPRASFVNIGGGTIDASQVSVSGSMQNNVLWLAGEQPHSNLRVSDGSVLTTQQLYVSFATGSAVTVTDPGTAVSATATTVYGELTLANGATLASGPLNLATGAGGMLTIESGARVTSSSATVTGGAASGPIGFNVTGQNSAWTVNGPMSIEDTTGLVAGGAQLQVLGGSLTLSSVVTPAATYTSTLTVNGDNSRLEVSGDATVADSGVSTLSLQAGGVGQVGGNLVIANQASSLGTLALDAAGTDLAVSGDATVGKDGIGTLNLTNAATLEAANVTIGETAPANGGSTDPVTGLHTQGVSTASIGSGAKLSTGDLTVGQSGYGAVTLNDGSIVADGSSTIASEAGSEGQVTLNSTSASWQTAGLTVGDSGTAVLQINLGHLASSGEVSVGDQSGSKGTVSITAGSLAVGSDLTVGGQGKGMFAEEPTGTLTVGGNMVVGDQSGSTGKVTLDGKFSLGGTLTIGASGTGSVLMQLGASDSGGGGSLTTPAVVLGDQQSASGTLALDGAGTSFETSALTVGSFGKGKLTLTNGAALISNGAVTVTDQVSSLINTASVASLSKFNVNGTLTVGGAGIGTLSVASGGKVTSIDDLTLGDTPAASGIATVSGVQSALASTINYGSALVVGHDGTGELTVSGGGLVAPTATGSGSVEVGADTGSTGSVHVSGMDSGSGLAARLVATNLSVGGTSLAAGGAGTITVGAGGSVTVKNTLTLWHRGSVDVTGGGRVTVGTGAAARTGAVQIDAGGTLHGSGTIDGSLINAGGTVSPGDPVTLTVNGDYLQTGGVLDLQVAGTGPGQADLIAATGNVQITGGVVDLQFIDGYLPTTGAQFSLFTGSSVDLSSSLLEFNGGAADFAFTTAFNPANDTYLLTDTGPTGGGGSSVPEPPTWPLALVGIGLLGLSRWRQRQTK
jgi:T5SS/PEP-CTERM-associated repeat protein